MQKLCVAGKELLAGRDACQGSTVALLGRGLICQKALFSGFWRVNGGQGVGKVAKKTLDSRNISVKLKPSISPCHSERKILENILGLQRL